jgi:hypothetical protein
VFPTRRSSATGAPLIVGPPRVWCPSAAERVESSRLQEGECTRYCAGRVAVLVYRIVRGHSENQIQSRGGQHRRGRTPCPRPRSRRQDEHADLAVR